MIRSTSHLERTLAPRFSFFGVVQPWRPLAVNATRLEAAATLLGSVMSSEVGGLQLAQPGFVQMPRIDVNQAISIPIGWFAEVEDTRLQGLLVRESSGPPLGLKVPAQGTARESDLAMRLAAALQPPLSALLSPDGVLEWPAALHGYQREGIAALLSRKEILLADDMGLGKTIQAIAALRILFFQNQIENALVVCPASLVSQWARELAKWAPDLKVLRVMGTASERGMLWRMPAHVKLISYDTLRGDVLDLRDSPAMRKEWSVVVLDEASRIKNPDTGVTIACKRLPCNRRWALTGTPLENRIDDVISILEFLLGDSNQSRPVVSSPYKVRETLKAVQLRRKKQDVLADLPAKQVIEQIVDLMPLQREAYDRAEHEGVVRLKEAGRSITVTHILELIARLKQICNNDPSTGESAKIADIEERLETLVEEGHRALVFSQFTDSDFGVEMAAGRLNAFSPLTYTGAMSANQKARVVDLFLAEDRHKALILSLRAGGVGLNLQAASYVFHLDRWWNPAIEEQAESRAHRMGQPFPVTVYRYVCAGTIEERIDAKLKAKRELFREIVDDVSMDLSTTLTEEELFGLFNLEPPRKQEPAPESAAPFSAMSGAQFEEWLALQLREIGFTVSLTPTSRDGGIDLVATRSDQLQIESKLMIQCKNHRDPVGVTVVRELRGVVPDRTSGTTPVVACPAGFTADAIAFAEHSGMLLWSENDLREIETQASRSSV